MEVCWLVLGEWKIRFFERIFKTWKKDVRKYVGILFDKFCRNISILKCFGSFQFWSFPQDFFSIYLWRGRCQSEIFVAYVSYSGYAEMVPIFYNTFETGSLILLVRGSQFEYSVMLRLLTMLEKKVFKTFIIFIHNSLL